MLAKLWTVYFFVVRAVPHIVKFLATFLTSTH